MNDGDLEMAGTLAVSGEAVQATEVVVEQPNGNDVVIRPVRLEDAEELAALYLENQRHLVPFIEIRDESFFTAAGQRTRIARATESAAAGESWRFAIIDGEALAGTIGVTNVIRGPVQGAKVGYWVAHGRDGKGLATRAVADVVRFAFDQVRLHRLEAWTLVDNVASQRVLEKNGFTRFGLAKALLLIDGEWRDHLLFECIALDGVDTSS